MTDTSGRNIGDVMTRGPQLPPDGEAQWARACWAAEGDVEEALRSLRMAASMFREEYGDGCDSLESLIADGEDVLAELRKGQDP